MGRPKIIDGEVARLSVRLPGWVVDELGKDGAASTAAREVLEVWAGQRRKRQRRKRPRKPDPEPAPERVAVVEVWSDGRVVSRG